MIVALAHRDGQNVLLIALETHEVEKLKGGTALPILGSQLGIMGLDVVVEHGEDRADIIAKVKDRYDLDLEQPLAVTDAQRPGTTFQ